MVERGPAQPPAQPALTRYLNAQRVAGTIRRRRPVRCWAGGRL